MLNATLCVQSWSIMSIIQGKVPIICTIAKREIRDNTGDKLGNLIVNTRYMHCTTEINVDAGVFGRKAPRLSIRKRYKKDVDMDVY